VGDDVSCMVVARLIDAPRWGEKADASPLATDPGG
jgi:hypothetical protein